MATQRIKRSAQAGASRPARMSSPAVPPSALPRLGLAQGDTDVALLAEAGVKPTWTRLAVLAVLRVQVKAQSVTEILQHLLTQGIALNVGTVYVTLRALSAAGVVVTHTDVGRRTLYALPGEAYVVSVTCSLCGRIQVLDAAATRSFVAAVCHEQGYLPRQARLSISAVCLACAA